MKPKGLLIAVVLLAVLGGRRLVVEQQEADRQAKSPPTPHHQVLTIPDDQFQEIRIKKVTGEAHRRSKRDNGKWQITAPKPLAADQDAVASMVTTLSVAQRRQGDRGEGRRISSLRPGHPDAGRHRSSARTARPTTC